MQYSVSDKDAERMSFTGGFFLAVFAIVTAGTLAVIYAIASMLFA